MTVILEDTVVELNGKKITLKSGTNIGVKKTKENSILVCDDTEIITNKGRFLLECGDIISIGSGNYEVIKDCKITSVEDKYLLECGDCFLINEGLGNWFKRLFGRGDVIPKIKKQIKNVLKDMDPALRKEALKKLDGVKNLKDIKDFLDKIGGNEFENIKNLVKRITNLQTTQRSVDDRQEIIKDILGKLIKSNSLMEFQQTIKSDDIPDDIKDFFIGLSEEKYNKLKEQGRSQKTETKIQEKFEGKKVVAVAANYRNIIVMSLDDIKDYGAKLEFDMSSPSGFVITHKNKSLEAYPINEDEAEFFESNKKQVLDILKKDPNIDLTREKIKSMEQTTAATVM